MHLERLKAHFQPAKIYEDERTIVYDRELLPKPSRTVLLCTDGWRERVYWYERALCVVNDDATLSVFVPEHAPPFRIRVQATANRRPQTVELHRGAEVLAHWNVTPGLPLSYNSPPISLPPGLHELRLDIQGASSNASRKDHFFVSRVRLKPARNARVDLAQDENPETIKQ